MNVRMSGRCRDALVTEHSTLTDDEKTANITSLRKLFAQLTKLTPLRWREVYSLRTEKKF